MGDKKSNTSDLQNNGVSADGNDTDDSQSSSGTNIHKKRPSLRKSITMSQLFTKSAEEEEEELIESEFAEEIAPLPVSPAPTKSEKPVSRSSSTRSDRKTHVRYKSDRTSEISINKNDMIPGYDYKRRESMNVKNSDLIREKLVLKNDDEIIAQYQLGNCIGKGQFGSVYRALNCCEEN